MIFIKLISLKIFMVIFLKVARDMNWLETDTVMMKQTTFIAILMVVTAVDFVSLQITVQNVCVLIHCL